MKILIAECGSTKCEWAILDESYNILKIVETKGFLSSLASKEEIKRIVEEVKEKDVKKIFFYGPGAHKSKDKLLEAFLEIYPGSEIDVQGDLLGSARALCGKNKGIVCILGTGSNSCYYNGSVFEENIPALGHALGNEGAATHIGKEFIRSYYYKELHEDLLNYFSKYFPKTTSELVRELYSQKNPSSFIGNFAKIASEKKDHEQIKSIVKKCLEEFIIRKVVPYSKSREVLVHFTGSIAYHYEDILEELLNKHNLKKGEIVRRPLIKLVEYHKNNNI